MGTSRPLRHGSAVAARVARLQRLHNSKLIAVLTAVLLAAAGGAPNQDRDVGRQKLYPLQRFMEGYFALHGAFYRDSLDSAHKAAADLEMLELKPLMDSEILKGRAEVSEIERCVRGVILSGDLNDARESLAGLGAVLNGLLLEFGLPAGYEGRVVGFSCQWPGDHSPVAVWLQADADARNPFFGECDDRRGLFLETWGLHPRAE